MQVPNEGPNSVLLSQLVKEPLYFRVHCFVFSKITYDGNRHFWPTNTNFKVTMHRMFARSCFGLQGKMVLM